VYMHPRAVVHKIDRSVPLDVAATYNVIACGLGWTVDFGGAQARPRWRRSRSAPSA
jgi:hypothetical protein